MHHQHAYENTTFTKVMAPVFAATANGGSGSVTGLTVVDVDTEDSISASSGREARNLAEKQRRDKLNASIQELATMVPHAAESTRRLDKTAVLRFATHGLRLQYVFGKSAIRYRRRLNLKGDCNSECDAKSQKQSNKKNVTGDSPQLTETLMQLLDSIFITLTCNGQIVLISGSVEQLLGHCQSDLYGQNLLQITHPDDQALLRQQLVPRNIETLFYKQPRQRNSQLQSAIDASDDDEEELVEMEQDQNLENVQTCTPSTQTVAHLAAIDERLRADRRCFNVRLARASSRADATRHYEVVKIDGCFRRSDSSMTSTGTPNYPIVSQIIRRSRNNTMIAAATATTPTSTTLLSESQHDAIAQAALHGISGNDIVLVAMARIMREDSTCLNLMCRQPEPYQLEYRTRHLIDGSIIDCDQRIGIVAGYMKDEVRNLSPFSFMHLDDVRWVIVALRQMYDMNNDYGESCYRLLSRNGHFIYLQSKGFLEIDKGTNKVHSFLCVNTLLDEQAGKLKVQEMKNKFSTIIRADIPKQTSPDLPASRAPQQLERIVLYLIENLQKSASDNVDASNISGANEDASNIGRANEDALDDIWYNAASSNIFELEEQAQSPTQLALVPPPPGDVKHSISKSVNVVNVTSARNLQYQQQKQRERTVIKNGTIHKLRCCLSETSTLLPASKRSTEMTDDAYSFTSQTLHAPSTPRLNVLQRLELTPKKVTDNKNPSTDTVLPPSELQAVLSSTLCSLDTKLVTMGEEAQTLCKQQQHQCSVLFPKFERQMDAIMLEHQMQKQLLVNIRSEYETAAATETPEAHQTVSLISKKN